MSSLTLCNRCSTRCRSHWPILWPDGRHHTAFATEDGDWGRKRQKVKGKKSIAAQARGSEQEEPTLEGNRWASETHPSRGAQLHRSSGMYHIIVCRARFTSENMMSKGWKASRSCTHWFRTAHWVPTRHRSFKFIIICFRLKSSSTSNQITKWLVI